MNQHRPSRQSLITAKDDLEAAGRRFTARIDVMAAADRTRAILDPPDCREAWRYYPFMFLENPLICDFGTQPGVLYHDLANDGENFRFSVFLLTHGELKQLTREEFEAAHRIEYDSWEELVAAGWMPA